MEHRPGTSARDSDEAGNGNGYPLREEADESFPPAPSPMPPAEPFEDEIYAAAPVEPAVPVVRRRRFVPPGGPWPAVLAVLLLLAGLGVAYAVSRPGPSTQPAAPAAAGAAESAPAATQASTPPTPPSAPAPRHPAPKQATAPATTQASAPFPPPTAASHTPPPTVAEKPAMVAVPNVTGTQGLAAAHTLLGDHLVASRHYVPSTQPARRVVSQWPPPGGKVPRGTTVLLNLSQGLRSNG